MGDDATYTAAEWRLAMEALAILRGRRNELEAEVKLLRTAIAAAEGCLGPLPAPAVSRETLTREIERARAFLAPHIEGTEKIR